MLYIHYNIELSSLSLLKKEGLINRSTSVIKPFLSSRHKISRIRHCLNNIDDDTNLFQTFFDMIHVDEKWFFLRKVSKGYILFPEETFPWRTCQHKYHITKVMFLYSVSRPRFDHHKHSFFDGKIGICPFVEKEPAKRDSNNHEKGTIVTNITTVTGPVYREMMLENLSPEIKERLPTTKSKLIIIQQDNPPPS